ncbi:hypothetical protein [Bacillus thuringiensis]|uniref:hypothetical protein n=1 Tax=Bacillus thuringiensis TaxID=1428 RepID=UPI0020D28A8F|nr:hypothetical protein [Bacillus thuringiensis]
MNDTPERHFKPSDNVTHGQMTVMLNKALYNYKDTFQDSPADTYYYEAAHNLMHFG